MLSVKKCLFINKHFRCKYKNHLKRALLYHNFKDLLNKILTLNTIDM